MCDVYHVVGIVTTYGVTVALWCLLVHLLAFLLLEDCEVSVCVLLSLDYCMYFYTEITYILYVTSVF